MKNSGFTTARFLGAALIFIAAAVAGFALYRGSLPSAELTEAPAASAADGATVVEPAAEPAGKQKQIPDVLPDIVLANLEGKPTPLHDFAGRPLMVNFWATWCAPCRREIPLLNRIRAERQAQGAEIVGIAVDFKDDVLKFVAKIPVKYPLLMGEEDGLAASEAFGMGMMFPYSVFVDSQNRILTVKVGELHEDEANFAFDRLRDIDNGIMTREAAQAAVAEAFREMAAERARHEAASGTPAAT